MIVLKRTLGLSALLALIGAGGACSSSKPASGSGSTSDAGLTVGGGTGGSSGGVTCAANQISCGTACVDPQNDPQNCGGCGTACGKGQACSGGSCIATCAGTGGTVCSGSCVDLQTDEANCGSCGHACTAGEGCSNGSCQASGCTPPLTACGGNILSCTNLASDPANCGSCGHACDGGVCTLGECQTNKSCDTGETLCNGNCTDTQTDGQNCGGCAGAGGQVCGSGQSCQGGVCVSPCAPDAGLTACGSGSALVCTNLATDPDNCGSCGHGCAASIVCAGGVCGCPSGLSLCGSLCTNTASDPENCGACGNVCSSDLCHAGSCLFCPAGSIGFGALVVFDAGTTPGYAGAADFVGNGLLDIAAANTGDGTLGVLMNVDAGFAPQVTFATALDTAVLAVGKIVGSLGGDGRPDVATLSAATDSFSLLVNQSADGGPLQLALQGPFNCTEVEEPATLGIADVNGDGLPDIVVGGMGLTLTPPFFSGALDIFLQSDAGFPSSASASVLAGQSVQALATVSLGPDGGAALATVDNTGNAVYVLPLPGPGTPVSYAVGNGPVSIAAGDLDGDGFGDLAVLNQADGTATVLFGQAGGTFTAGLPISIGTTAGLGGLTLSPQSLTVGDVNGDGVPDLLVSVADTLSLGNDVVVYLINQGNGTFAPPVSVPAATTGFTPLSVALRDLNGDGIPDILLGNSGTGDFVGVLYGQCP